MATLITHGVRIIVGNVRPRIASLEDRRVPAMLLVTTTADAGPGSLREAVLAVNGKPRVAEIDFAIPGDGLQVINLQAPLPALTQPVTLDGTTQPGYQNRPLIELLGSGAGTGLTIADAPSRVLGLRVEGFQTGIDVESGSVTIQANTVRNNLGVGIYDPYGVDTIQDNRDIDNGGDGVYNETGFVATSGNTIRHNARNGVELFEREAGGPVTNNVIQGNGGDGVLVDRAAGAAILNNSISANGNLGIELTNNGNFGQAAPVLNRAVASGERTVIFGTLTAASDATFTLQFFGGDGAALLGQATVTTDDSGYATFRVSVNPTFSGDSMVATATGPYGTSEFSTPIIVFAPEAWRGSDA